jgi:hypothetical protein
MASTYSTSLKLELIGDGEQSGIWGQTTNNNLGTLLEQAITGVVDITMADANYTLTNFNGVSDESRNAVLVVGGTNAAVRDVIAPLVEKLYVVKNNTVGGFGIRIIGVSGTGITVPSGATVWVYCDGTNFNAINTESVGNFEVNGNLTVTGNTNAVAATYTGNVAALNLSTANVTATGAGAFTGNVSAANFTGAGLTITSINASNISAGTIANARTTAASANGASTIVARDSNGSFAGNVVTATLFSGSGASLTSIPNSATTANSANGASTIVARDSNGSFAANVGTFVSISGAVSGNGANLTNINASNISSGTIANARTTAATANGASTIVLRDSNGSFAGNVVTGVTGTFSGNVSALNISTANVTATGAGAFTGNVSANNVTITTTLTGNNANLSGTVRMTSTGAVLVPAGTTAQRPTAATGLFRFNSSLTRFEGYNGANWGTLGGATGGGNDQVFYENGQNVTTDYTIAGTKNAMSAGPITIDGGATVTVDIGANWVIV